MGYFKQRDKIILQALVSDCVNFGLSEKESLQYIEARFGKSIAARTYYLLKKKIDNGQYSKEWLSYFTKVGFLVTHKKIIDLMEMIQKDTLKEYLAEKEKTEPDQRSEHKIIRLRNEIRENAKLLQELSLGTPIIAQIKAKLENVEMLQSGK